MNLEENEPISEERLEQLRRTAGAGPVLILTHDNPDPDALASGKALATLLKEAWAVSTDLRYSGLVLRAENRALLNLLTPEWQPCEALPDLNRYTAVALVDTQPGAGNNRFPPGLVPQIVIDHHHPLRFALDVVPFVDVRPETGATVTLLDQYLAAARIVPDVDLATAMFYGLKTDTRALSRGTTDADVIVYLRLLEQIDRSKLIQIEQAGLPAVDFCAVYQGLKAVRVFGHSALADLGNIHRPDLPAEMADFLIRLRGMRAVLCLGVHDQTLHLSVRSVPLGEDAGLLVQKMIVAPGKAGGHGTMAGGQIPLAGLDAKQQTAKIIDRFLGVMQETGPGEDLC